MDVSFVVVNYRAGELCRRLADSLEALPAGLERELLIADNAPADPDSARPLAQRPGVEWLPSERNAGFGAGCNEAIARAKGRIVWLVNPDAHFEEDIASPMLEAFGRDPKLGAAGPSLWFGPKGDASRTLQETARPDPSPADYWRNYSMFSRWKAGAAASLPAPEDAPPVSADWLMGASLALRREALDSLGEAAFDERFFLYFEDADLCRRLRGAGWNVRLLPGLAMVHLSQRSSSREKRLALTEFFKSLFAYADKWMPPADRARIRRQARLDMRLRLLASVARPGSGERRAAYRDILRLAKTPAAPAP